MSGLETLLRVLFLRRLLPTFCGGPSCRIVCENDIHWTRQTEFALQFVESVAVRPKHSLSQSCRRWVELFKKTIVEKRYDMFEIGSCSLERASNPNDFFHVVGLQLRSCLPDLGHCCFKLFKQLIGNFSRRLPKHTNSQKIVETALHPQLLVNEMPRAQQNASIQELGEGFRSLILVSRCLLSSTPLNSNNGYRAGQRENSGNERLIRIGQSADVAALQTAPRVHVCFPQIRKAAA